jgi:hypothetical protein
VNKEEYINRLSELLETSYRQLKESKGRSQFGGEHIQGFMEAGLICGEVTKADLEAVIDSSYKTVFGISFKDRNNASMESPEALDVPTWIRRGR